MIYVPLQSEVCRRNFICHTVITVSPIYDCEAEDELRNPLNHFLKLKITVKRVMPRASKLYFAYPKKFSRNLSEIEVCKFGADRFDDGCIEKFRTISIETPRKSFIFSGKKVFLFDGTSSTNSIGEISIQTPRQMESYDLITSKKDILPDLPLKTVLGSPVIVGKYIYLFGKGARGRRDVTSCTR